MKGAEKGLIARNENEEEGEIFKNHPIKPSR